MCRKEFGSDTPKWVFHRGGWNPEISDILYFKVQVKDIRHDNKYKSHESLSTGICALPCRTVTFRPPLPPESHSAILIFITCVKYAIRSMPDLIGLSTNIFPSNIVLYQFRVNIFPE
jgi:hypothetical protein